MTPGVFSALTVAQLGGFTAVVIAVVAFVRVVVPVLRSGVTLLRRTGHFLDDWTGEPARPGQPARPGIPEQLQSLQQEQMRVSRELQTNGGSTVKDAVRRIEAGQIEDRARLDLLASLVGGFVGQEQASRIEGNRASAEAWRAIQAVNENDHPPTDPPP